MLEYFFPANKNAYLTNVYLKKFIHNSHRKQSSKTLSSALKDLKKPKPIIL